MSFSPPGLICAATQEELQTFGLTGAVPLRGSTRVWRIREGYAGVTGAGTPITLLHMMPWMSSLSPNWILNIGIAGAYEASGLEVGDVVVGTSEIFADLGVELPEEEAFTPMGKLPFSDDLFRTPMTLEVPEWVQDMEKPVRVRTGPGATVNQCTGRSATGDLRRQIFDVDFESMEGAAFALAATVLGIPCMEVRAISNIAADRDMRPENVQTALNSLRAFWEAHRSKLM